MLDPVREALKVWVAFCEDPENLRGDHDDNGPGEFTMPCGCCADMIWRSHKGPFSPSPFPPEPFPHADNCPLMQAHAALDLPAEEEKPCGVCYTTNCLHSSSGCDFNCDCHTPLEPTKRDWFDKMVEPYKSVIEAMSAAKFSVDQMDVVINALAPSEAAESEDDDECPACGAEWAPEWVGKIKPTNPRETPDE